MDLFVVNRYEGESNKDVEGSNEARILEKLQKKINKRKKARLAAKAQKSKRSAVTKKEPAVVEEIQIKPDEDLPDVVAEPEETQNLEEINETELQNNNAQEVATEESKKADGAGFTILGVDSFKKREKVKRFLPYWLAHPTIMSSDLQEKTFTVDSIVQLSDTLKDNLRSIGVKYLFPVQATLLPWLLEGLNLPEPLRQQDVCVSAPTGSGKTLAFVLPIIQALSSRRVRRIRALVVLPVHELAVQVAKVFRTMCNGTDLKVVLLAAQSSFIVEQSQLVKKSYNGQYLCNVDIVVSTAGRLVEHLHSTPGFSFKYLKYLVLDEADKVMEFTQNDWLSHLEKHIMTETQQDCTSTKLSLSALHEYGMRPQKLLFSATLSQDPEKLQRMRLFQPQLFTTVMKSKEAEGVTDEERGEFIGKYTTPAELEEFFCVSELMTKPLALYLLIKRECWKHVLCFTNSLKAAHRLSILLQSMAKDMKISELSGALNFKTREETLKKFSDGDINILISTDALARGMDIENVEIVISYDFPKYIKNYIHRIGRTARAGRLGKAVTLLQKSEILKFQEILKNGGKDSVPEMKLTSDDIEAAMEDYNKALEVLKTTLEEEGEEEILKTKCEKLPQHMKRKRRNFLMNVKRKKAAVQ